MSKFALLSSLLLASVPLAVSSSHIGARHVHHHHAHQASVNPGSNDTVDDSTNWAGVMLTGQNGTFASVTGTFTVPTASGANDSVAGIWVGIDSIDCGSILTGIDVVANGTDIRYGAWFQWLPENSHYYYSDLDIGPGDVITANVTALTPTTGLVVLENHTRGLKASQTLNASTALCASAAEWIVAVPMTVNGSVPFANLSTVTFVDAFASGAGGTYSPCCDEGNVNVTVIDMKVDGRVLANTSIEGCNVTVQRA